MNIYRKVWSRGFFELSYVEEGCMCFGAVITFDGAGMVLNIEADLFKYRVTFEQMFGS